MVDYFKKTASKHPIGKYIKMGDVIVAEEEGKLTTYIQMTEWDARAILKETGNLGGLAAHFMSDSRLNDLFLTALEQPMLQKMMITFLKVL